MSCSPWELVLLLIHKQQATTNYFSLTRDITRVSITEFNLDMVQGIPNLTFNDMVNIDTLDVSSIILNQTSVVIMEHFTS